MKKYEEVKKYRHTFNGFTGELYRTQRGSCKKRGQRMPNYTLDILRNWINAQPNFKKLWTNWCKSGYVSNLKPSLDRIDESRPYILNNIKIVTWQENRERKRVEVWKEGAKNSPIIPDKPKPVMGLKGDEVITFDSTKEAALHFGCHIKNITRCLNGYQNTAMGCVWKYDELKKA